MTIGLFVWLEKGFILKFSKPISNGTTLNAYERERVE